MLLKVVVQLEKVMEYPTILHVVITVVQDMEGKESQEVSTQRLRNVEVYLITVAITELQIMVMRTVKPTKDLVEQVYKVVKVEELSG